MTTITAKGITRSRSFYRRDLVLSTLLCRYPRWIHAEGRTHRQLYIGEQINMELATPSLMEDPALSRNASSSRALPVKKLIEDVENDPAVPMYWGMNRPGMQATEELPPALKDKARDIWMRAMEDAIKRAKELAHLADIDGDPVGAHKQIVNRLLEPFSHITVVVSATQWSNFLYLRDHADAEPHIQMLARAIKDELARTDNISTLMPGDWHLPFITPSDRWEYLDNPPAENPNQQYREAALDGLKKLSVARCASTSYKTVDGFDMTMERATALHDKLIAMDPLHASPAEHVAQADELVEKNGYYTQWFKNPHQHGNFVGFRQYRKMLPNECR